MGDALAFLIVALLWGGTNPWLKRATHLYPRHSQLQLLLEPAVKLLYVFLLIRLPLIVPHSFTTQLVWKLILLLYALPCRSEFPAYFVAYSVRLRIKCSCSCGQ